MSHKSYNTYDDTTLRPSYPISYTFSVADRYGAPFEQLKPPDGYEFTGEFRPVPADKAFSEHWFNPQRLWYSHRSEHHRLPVLILRPLPKRKRIIFEESPDGSWLKDFLSGHFVPADEPGHRGLRYTARLEEF